MKEIQMGNNINNLTSNFGNLKQPIAAAVATAASSNAATATGTALPASSGDIVGMTMNANEANSRFNGQKKIASVVNHENVNDSEEKKLNNQQSHIQDMREKYSQDGWTVGEIGKVNEEVAKFETMMNAATKSNSSNDFR
jgi:hypothetical protein